MSATRFEVRRTRSDGGWHAFLYVGGALMAVSPVCDSPAAAEAYAKSIRNVAPTAEVVDLTNPTAATTAPASAT